MKRAITREMLVRLFRAVGYEPTVPSENLNVEWMSGPTIVPNKEGGFILLVPYIDDNFLEMSPDLVSGQGWVETVDTYHAVMGTVNKNQVRMEL